MVANVAVLAATTYSASDPNAQTSYNALAQKVTANLNGQPGTQQINDIGANLANAQTAILLGIALSLAVLLAITLAQRYL